MTSKVDQLRALREARWTSNRQPVKPTLKTPALKPTNTKSFEVKTEPEPKTPKVLVQPEPAVPSTTVNPVDSTTLIIEPTTVEPETVHVTTNNTETTSLTCPPVQPGKPIHQYKDIELSQLARWIISSKPTASDEEITTDIISFLGFKRKGKNITTRISIAVTTAHTST